MSLFVRLRFLFLFLFIIISLISSELFSQSLTFIDSPTGFEDPGYQGQPVLYNGKLYMKYRGGSSSSGLLAEYNGDSIRIIPNPTGFTFPGQGYLGTPIVYGNNLYLQYFGNGSQYQLVSYDGTNTTPITNPAGFDGTLAGYSSHPVVYNGKLYMAFRDNSGSVRFMEYDGTSFNSYGTTYDYDSFSTFEFNGKLYGRFRANGIGYLGEFDGTTLTLLPHPNGYDNGYLGAPFVYNGKAYLMYRSNTGLNTLVEYDGSSFTAISNPAGFPEGYSGVLGEYNGDYYVAYRDVNRNRFLFKFDGTTLTSFPNPVGYDGPRGMTEYNGKFYSRVEGSNDEFFLAEFDGASITIIPTPSGYIFRNKERVHNGKLYIRYQDLTTFAHHLAVFDGTNVSFIPHPTGYELDGSESTNIVFDEDLYFQYEDSNGDYILTRVDEASTCGAVTDLADARNNLGQTIDVLAVSKGLRNSLKKKINKAVYRYCIGTLNSALGQLNAFMNQVEDKRGSDLTDSEADNLICQAQAIKDSMIAGTANCNNSSSNRVANPTLSATIGVYPNPFDQVLTIDWQGEAEEVNISLINMQGQRVFSKIMWVKGEHSLQIPDLPIGMYILNIEGENTLEKIKLIKQ